MAYWDLHRPSDLFEPTSLAFFLFTILVFTSFSSVLFTKQTTPFVYFAELLAAEVLAETDSYDSDAGVQTQSFLSHGLRDATITPLD